MKRIVFGIGGTAMIVVILLGIGMREHEMPIPETATTAPTVATTTQRAIARVVAMATTTAERVHDAVVDRDQGWKQGIATIFWVGEGETDDNGYISNAASAWDMRWMEHFGGLDDPDDRCGYNPCAFTPKENPFYVALPYSDLHDDGQRKENASIVPWNDTSSQTSVLKNRWIEVRHLSYTCYGQWQDVGPFEEDDAAYVFGEAETPKNTFGEKAGIDLSPALADCLKIDGSDAVMWRHVDADNVPTGPWRAIITTRQ